MITETHRPLRDSSINAVIARLLGPNNIGPTTHATAACVIRTTTAGTATRSPRNRVI
ncbi:hypothetical protein ACIA8C_20980 [Nocardia sp. NPDC051321]|uniref:hypothetical protein n=1 Tax=Nocardia sp. NPDC051321 TaxID=3364323 RepID=UPI0037A74B42